MSKADRQDLRELLPQVSPEPWTVGEGSAYDDGCGEGIGFRYIDGWTDTGDGEWLCLADAEVIVRARSLIPKLLDWADKVEECLRKMRLHL